MIDLRVGGAYRIAMSRPDAAAAVSVAGQFLEVWPPERLVYTWRWQGAFDDLSETRVTVEFVEFPGGTELILRHEGFVDAGLRQQHRTGWVAACERMDRALPPAGPTGDTGFGS